MVFILSSPVCYRITTVGNACRHRQMNAPWALREVFQGASATMLRNSLLFATFMIYIDLSKQVVPGGLSPFWTGAICANLAWLTTWPMDVAKSQVHSNVISFSFVLHADSRLKISAEKYSVQSGSADYPYDLTPSTILRSDI